MPTNSANLLEVMQKRSKMPQVRAFGARLRELRGRRSLETVSRRLADLGVPLGGSTLHQYEKGRVWAPDPCVLGGLAEIYRVDVRELIGLLRANRANENLSPIAQIDGIEYVQDRTPIPADTVQPAPATPSTLDPIGDAHAATTETAVEILKDRAFLEILETAAKLRAMAYAIAGGEDPALRLPQPDISVLTGNLSGSETGANRRRG